MQEQQMKYNIGQLVVSDDSQVGDESQFVLGVIADSDKIDSDKDSFSPYYRIEWVDAETNHDAQEWFPEDEVTPFVLTYKDYLKKIL